MKKLVLNLDLHGDKEKKKAMKAVAGLLGIDSIAMDMKEKKLTVIGDVDPVCVVTKLRMTKKQWCTEIVTVGPAEEKKDEDKKDGDKKEDEKIKTCYPYYPPYYVMRVDESPTSCTMC